MNAFRYFPGFPQGAAFDAKACHFCGKHPALDGAWLDFDEDYDDPPPVCTEDLIADKARVAIPRWITLELTNRVAAHHSNWNAEHVARYVAERTHELAHTPPIPWLQENEWPLCSDDFATYSGQLTREVLTTRAGNAAAAQADLRAIMAQERPQWTLDAQHLDAWWQRLGDFLRIYEFRCGSDGDIHVVQTM